jgi:hypothetical protein
MCAGGRRLAFGDHGSNHAGRDFQRKALALQAGWQRRLRRFRPEQRCGPPQQWRRRLPRLVACVAQSQAGESGRCNAIELARQPVLAEVQADLGFLATRLPMALERFLLTKVDQHRRAPGPAAVHLQALVGDDHFGLPLQQEAGGEARRQAVLAAAADHVLAAAEVEHQAAVHRLHLLPAGQPGSASGRPDSKSTRPPSAWAALISSAQE